MARDKFFSALKSGFNFCDVVFGWDSNDQLYDKPSVTGWKTGFPDAGVMIDPTTARDAPLEGDMLFFLGNFIGPTAAVCPRSLLQRVIGRAADMGFAATAAAEFEFFVFDETPHSVRAKGYKDLKNLDARMVRLFDAALVCRVRLLSRTDEAVPRHGHAARGSPHGDRSGRA